MIYQCSCCGCIDNTALAKDGRIRPGTFDWSFIEDLKGKPLCYACAPLNWRDGKSVNRKPWHNRFCRDYLPIGRLDDIIAANPELQHACVRTAHNSLLDRPNRDKYNVGEYVSRPVRYAVQFTDGRCELWYDTEHELTPKQLKALRVDGHMPRRELIQRLLDKDPEVTALGIKQVGMYLAEDRAFIKLRPPQNNSLF